MKQSRIAQRRERIRQSLRRAGRTLWRFNRQCVGGHVEIALRLHGQRFRHYLTRGRARTVALWRDRRSEAH